MIVFHLEKSSVLDHLIHELFFYGLQAENYFCILNVGLKKKEDNIFWCMKMT